ncbi:DNA-processing protein DprA [Roseococcus sp. YIM B11640]|uniref:DNA-processing protein DprA n=1 Tax=Roseococcus sp. YIM B11640 TaxID=3133973 RepID=UPI003C7EB1F5
MRMEQALALLRLARSEGIGPVHHRRLIQRHGGPEAALEALGPRAWARDAALREMEALERMGARLLFHGHSGYPALLALIEDAPLVLAAQGSLDALEPRGVALVGARNASATGRRFAEELADALAVRGICVISGLARGIDTAAHEGALRSGTTIAAIAGGLDQPYPRENAGLQKRIAAEGGLVLSEAPLGTAPLARHFPRRNRIVAGLSHGVVVLEAALQSGTLITARLAAEAGRELFAVPGSPVDPRSRGANDLIRRGAHLTETVEDILQNLPEDIVERPALRLPLLADLPAEPVRQTPPPSDQGAQVLEMMGSVPIPVDELGRRCQLSPPKLSEILLELELSGRIETLPGNRVALA